MPFLDAALPTLFPYLRAAFATFLAARSIPFCAREAVGLLRVSTLLERLLQRGNEGVINATEGIVALR